MLVAVLSEGGDSAYTYAHWLARKWFQRHPGEREQIEKSGYVARVASSDKPAIVRYLVNTQMLMDRAKDEITVPGHLQWMLLTGYTYEDHYGQHLHASISYASNVGGPFLSLDQLPKGEIGLLREALSKLDSMKPEFSPEEALLHKLKLFRELSSIGSVGLTMRFRTISREEPGETGQAGYLFDVVRMVRDQEVPAHLAWMRIRQPLFDFHPAVSEPLCFAPTQDSDTWTSYSQLGEEAIRLALAVFSTFDRFLSRD